MRFVVSEREACAWREPGHTVRFHNHLVPTASADCWHAAARIDDEGDPAAQFNRAELSDVELRLK